MNVEILGLPFSQLLAILFISLGPVRIILVWLNIAPGLNRQEQLHVAWRITWVSVVLMVGIMLLGLFMIENLALSKESVGIGASIVLIVSSLTSRYRSTEPVASTGTLAQRAMNMAIYPLSVPTMINSAGLGILIIAAAYIRQLWLYLVFFGSVTAIFGINFGLMILVGRIQKQLSGGITALIGEVFSIILVSLGVYFILRSLSLLGLIKITGI